MNDGSYIFYKLPTYLSYLIIVVSITTTWPVEGEVLARIIILF